MTMPGFSAEDSLYRTKHHYVAAAQITATGSVIPQQLSVGLDDSQLYWCRLACAYCHFVGWYCWTCFICAWIIVIGW
jgi:hypothetical protein